MGTRQTQTNFEWKIEQMHQKLSHDSVCTLHAGFSTLIASVDDWSVPSALSPER